MSKIFGVTVYEPTQEKTHEYNTRAAKALAKILFKNLSAKNFERLINALEKNNKDEVLKD
ncbi:hypothetical protein [Crassaminicella profunda]|uniref:hypothetical protein n=1 Tax=Crassaminicella profunda TaxID=1286698 RepID=UPI001CA6200B|nr:hypothetical protein [Crassaminicella profunda]QZY56855.1 hypothetical protein K7H06_08030 [Crassaminicella profunda]